MDVRQIDFSKPEIWGNILEIIEPLSKEEIEAIPDIGTTSLLDRACTMENLGLIEALLGKGIDANGKERGNASPLCRVANSGIAANASKVLLDAGADINIDEKRGRRPLIFKLISNFRDLELLDELLEAGLNFDVKNSDGETPLTFLIHSINPCSVEQGKQYFAAAFLRILASYDDPLSLREELINEIYHSQPDEFRRLAPLAAMLANLGFGVHEGFSIEQRGDDCLYKLPLQSKASEYFKWTEDIALLKFQNHRLLDLNEVVDGSFQNFYTDALIASCKILDKIEKNLDKKASFKGLNPDVRDALAQNEGLKGLLKLALKSNTDISDYLFSKIDEKPLVRRIIESGGSETLMYFPYWQQFPDSFTKVLEVAKLVRDFIGESVKLTTQVSSEGSDYIGITKNELETQNDRVKFNTNFPPEAYKDLLDFDANLRGALAAKPNNLSVESVSEGSLSVQRGRDGV